MPISKSSTTRQSLRNKKKQTRLQFAVLPSSSPAKVNYDPAIQSRLASVRYEGARQTRSSTKNPTQVDTPLTPEPSSQIQRSLSESPISLPHSRKSSNSIDLDLQPNSESSEDEINVVLPSTKRRKVVADANHMIQEDTSTPTRRSIRIGGQSTPLSSAIRDRSGVQKRGDRGGESGRISELGSPETSGDEDGILAARPIRRRNASTSNTLNWRKKGNEDSGSDEFEEISRRMSTPKRKPKEFDFIADDDEVEFITSDDDTNTKSRKASASKETNISKSPRLRRLKRRSERKELEDDLADLRDSEPEEGTPRTRTRGGPVTTQKDKTREHFERLRRRRAGEEVSRETSPVEPIDSDEAIDIDFITQPSRRQNYSVSSGHSTDAEGSQIEELVDVDEDDFIVDDSTGRLGRPNPDIPLEFTSFASAKPKELFIYIIEWLVKNKIAPAFSRRDQVYRLAFDRVNDQVKAQAGSRLISSAWGATFKHAVLARPGMTVEHLGILGSDGIRTCDACNRSNHPATYDFNFTGQAYSQDTLEPFDQSDDEDDEDDDEIDKQSHDAAGHILAPQHQHFYLGSFCAANAEMGHKLTHWKYHLNQSLLEYLESQGVLSAEAILARDKLTQRKREREAEAIVDGMDATGKIDEFWKDFKDDLDDARLGMEDFEKKKGRGKGRVGNIRAFIHD